MKKHTDLILCGIIFACIFLLEFFTVYSADDFGNMISFYRNRPLSSGELPSLSSFLTVPDVMLHICREAWNHYLHETGRFESAILLRFLAGMPRWLYAIIAAMSFVALSRFIVKVACEKRDYAVGLLLSFF